MHKFITTIVVVIIVGAGAFFAGVKYGEGKSSAGGQGQANLANLSTEERQARVGQLGGAGFFVGGRGSRASGGFVAGEIIAKDDESITVKIREPRAPESQSGSKIVFFNPNTAITKSVGGSPADLAVGEQVAITGTANQDGSVSVRSIQIRPSLPQN